MGNGVVATILYQTVFFFPELRLTRPSKRRQRSEAREAVASVAQVLLHYTELASLRVGVPHATEGFRSLTIAFIAKKAGIGLKRAQRAIAVLKRGGYLKLIERFDTKEGGIEEEKRYIGLAAVKSLTPSFLKPAGLSCRRLQRSAAWRESVLTKRRSSLKGRPLKRRSLNWQPLSAIKRTPKPTLAVY
ncbi:hypothetical protein [Legionella tunisiensis]|uniref:hypothetical protein n=1 Tax=Legionella tunisiensis TaxID=1034944 RepID=UPI0002DD3734|nr:hypothetical protein [Legionella tunisiensis]